MFDIIGICVFAFCILSTSAADLRHLIREHNPGLNDSEYYLRQYNYGKRMPELEQYKELGNRLTKLEVHVEERYKHLASEVHEGNRLLRELEYRNEDLKAEIQELQNRLLKAEELAPRSPNGNNNLEETLKDLSTGIHLAVATLKSLKTNISDIHITTSSLLQQCEDTTRNLHNKRENQLEIPTGIFQAPTNNGSDLPKNCKDVQNRGETISGIYQIRPEGASKSFLVLCDLELQEGGWTYIHHRYDGGQDFFLSWQDYKYGFGNLAGEFWLGLEHIYELTGHAVNELLIELVDENGRKGYARYSAFSIGTEEEGYPLKVLGGFTGNANDSLIYHAGSKFSTKDVDRDNWNEGNCAIAHTGAWWYKSCDQSNLNGRYEPGVRPESQIYQSMYWEGFKGPQHGLSEAKMMVRPRRFNSPSIFRKRYPNRN